MGKGIYRIMWDDACDVIKGTFDDNFNLYYFFMSNRARIVELMKAENAKK